MDKLNFHDWVVLTYMVGMHPDAWPFKINTLYKNRHRLLKENGLINEHGQVSAAGYELLSTTDLNSLVKNSVYYNIEDILTLIVSAENNQSFITEQMKKELLTSVKFTFELFMRRVILDGSSRLYSMDNFMNNVQIDAFYLVNSVGDREFADKPYTRIDVMMRIKEIFIEEFLKISESKSIFHGIPFLNEIVINNCPLTDEELAKITAKILPVIKSPFELEDELHSFLDDIKDHSITMEMVETLIQGIRNVCERLNINGDPDLWESITMEYKVKCM